VGILAISRTICLSRFSGVVDVLRLRVEGGERRGGDEHAHRVGVVVEALHEALAHVLVDERVVVISCTHWRAARRGQLAVDQEVGHLEVRRLLGELLDGVAAVRRMPGVAVE
jgi:hypothetical protein